MVFDLVIQMHYFARDVPTACVSGAGADGGTPSSRKKAEAEKTA